MQKIQALIGMLSFAVAAGSSPLHLFDTTAGEVPIHAVALDSSLHFNLLFSDSHPLAAKLFYVAAILAVVGLLVWIYHGRGVFTVASILAYVGALSSMSMLIRNCYVIQGFKYPQFLTSTHFVATATVGGSVLLYRRITEGREIKVPDVECFVKGLVPVAVTFVLSLGCANNGLLLTNAHFVEMIGSSAPLCTAGVSILIGRGFNMKLMPALGLISISLVVIAFGEIAMSMLGLVVCVSGVVMRSIKSTVQHSLMGGSEWKAMDPVEVAVWTSVTCYVLMTTWSLATEGMAPYQSIMAWGPFLAVLYTCIGASILNIAALFVLRELGPVAQQIVGNLKGVLAIVGSVATLDEQVTVQQAAGYTFLLMGIFLYNKTDMDIKADAKKALESEANETTKIQKV